MVEAEVVGIGNLGGGCIAVKRLAAEAREERGCACAGEGGVIEEGGGQGSVVGDAAEMVAIEGAEEENAGGEDGGGQDILWCQ